MSEAAMAMPVEKIVQIVIWLALGALVARILYILITNAKLV